MAIPVAIALLKIGSKVYKSVKSYNKAKAKANKAKKAHDAFVRKNVAQQKKNEKLLFKK